MDEFVAVVSRVGVVCVAGVGGALFAFSAFVMAALGRMEPAEGIRAMQRINVTVFTPWFMVPFFGMAVVSVGFVVVSLLHMDRGWWLALLGAGVLYGLGVFGVTAFGNVPLNNRLAVVDPERAEGAALWRAYQRVWTRWNHVRVVASAGVVMLLVEVVRLVG